MRKDLMGVLRIIHHRLEGKNIRWMFVGSVSLHLHGVVDEVGDIDLLTDKSGAHEIYESLSEFGVKPPSWSETAMFKSHFGILEIEGMRVEIAGDFSEKSGSKWMNLSRRRLRHKEYKTIDGMRLPVTPLRMHLESYKILNREKDREKIRRLEEMVGKKG